MEKDYFDKQLSRRRVKRKECYQDYGELMPLLASETFDDKNDYDKKDDNDVISISEMASDVVVSSSELFSSVSIFSSGVLQAKCLYYALVTVNPWLRG